MQCFLILDDDLTPPRVICTCQPEEYAWFHGIDPNNMVETTDSLVVLQQRHSSHDLVKGESPRGVPEWECESSFQ